MRANWRSDREPWTSGTTPLRVFDSIVYRAPSSVGQSTADLVAEEHADNIALWNRAARAIQRWWRPRLWRGIVRRTVRAGMHVVRVLSLPSRPARLVLVQMLGEEVVRCAEWLSNRSEGRR